MPAKNRSRGFTLIEVLVALAVLALALGVLFQIFSTGLNNSRVAEAYAKATLLAQSKLASLGIEESLGEGENTGRFDGQFGWRVDVHSHEREERPVGQVTPLEPYEVVVTVYWGETDEERSVSLTTLRLAPGR